MMDAPYGKICLITLVTGERYEAKLIRFNKYVNAPDRWRREGDDLTKKERWIDTDLVSEWSIK